MPDKRQMIIDRLWIMKKAALEINALTTECGDASDACKKCAMADLDLKEITCAQIEDIAWIEIPG